MFNWLKKKHHEPQKAEEQEIPARLAKRILHHPSSYITFLFDKGCPCVVTPTNEGYIVIIKVQHGRVIDNISFVVSSDFIDSTKAEI